MKKADINNIVNEEVSKLRTIVEQEVNEYVGLGTLSALAIGAALAARLGFMSDEKLQQAIDTTKDKANKLVKALPIIGDKIEQRELRNKQMDGIQKYLNDELTDQDIIDIFKTNPELKKAMENIGVSYAYKDYYNLIRDLGGAANEWGNAHPKFKALRKKIKQGELDINENIPPVKPMSPKFTAKEFVEYVNDEFDSETLQLMQNVLAERMKFLDKMKDMANPRTVVQGYMRKDDLKENLGRYQVAIQEGAFSELEILADESSNFDEFLAKVKEEFPQIKYIKPDMEDFLQTLYQNNNTMQEITENPLDSGIFNTICEVAETNGFDKKIDNKFRTSTALVLHISKQLSEENRRNFVQDVREIKQAFNNEEFVL